MARKFLSLVTISAVFSSVSMANGLSGHEEEIVKSYTEPVSTTKAIADLEEGVAKKLKEVCAQSGVNVIRSLTFDIPFDVSGGTRFRVQGTAGDIQNPMFIYYSYPTVSAHVSFVCN